MSSETVCCRAYVTLRYLTMNSIRFGELFFALNQVHVQGQISINCRFEVSSVVITAQIDEQCE